MTINFNINIGVDSLTNRQPESSYYNTQQSSESEEQRFKRAQAEKRAIVAEMRQRDLEAMMKEMIRRKK